MLLINVTAVHLVKRRRIRVPKCSVILRTLLKAGLHRLTFPSVAHCHVACFWKVT